MTQSFTSCIRSLSDDTMVAVAPASQAMPRIGRDQVVGLEAGLLQAGNVEGAHRLADERELRDQIVGRVAAGAPCSPDTSRCGRFSRTCRTRPRDGSAARPASCRLQQLPQHVAEAEHGVDLQAVRTCAVERRQRVIGAEDVAGAVDQKDVVAFLERARRGAADLAAAGSCAASRLWRRQTWIFGTGMARMWAVGRL